MRGPYGVNLAGAFYSWQFIAGCALFLVAVGVVAAVLHRRTERRRQVTRYEFDANDRMRAVPPRGGRGANR